MDFRNKTKEELIFELQELKQKYDSLQKKQALDASESDILKHNREMLLNQVELEMRNEEMVLPANTLRQYEAQYKSLFENNHSVMLLIDPSTGEIKDANMAACQFYGWTRVEFLKKNIFQINTLSEAEVKAEMLKAETEKRKQYFFKHSLANGKVCEVEVYSGPIQFGNITLLFSVIHDITDRKIAEEKLQKSEETYRELIENISDVVYEITNEGIIKFVSPAVEKLLEYTPKEIIGRNNFDFVFPEDIPALASALAGLSQAEIPFLEYRYITKSGKIIWVRTKTTPIFVNGKLAGGKGTLSDITQEKLANNALIESELQYRTLANSGQALIWTATIDKKCDYFNQVWLDFTGRTLEQELGDGWAEGVHPDDLDRCFSIYSTSFDQQKPFSMDYRLRRNDGEYRWFQDYGKPRYNREGNFIGYIGHCLDITEIKNAEEKLQKRSDELAIVNNQLTMAQQIGRTGSWSYNLKTRELNGSIESLKLFGIGDNLEDFTSENIESCIPEWERVVQASYDLLQKGIPYNLEYEIHPADGSPARLITSKAELKFDDDGIAAEMFGVFQDITDRKQIERAIQQSELKYKALFFDSPVGYLIIQDGRFIECNRASELLIGADRSFLIGKTPYEISPVFQPNGRNSIEYAKELIEETFAKGNNSFEWTHRRVDGTEFIAQINLSVIEYEGNIVLFTTWDDITELKIAEEGMKKLSQAIEQSPVMTYITGTSGLIEYANPKVEVITGYSSAELLGQNPRILSSGEKSKKEYQILWKTISSGKEWKGEFRNKKKNGEFYWVSASISPVTNADGKVLHYLAVEEDITQRKLAEENIKRQNDRLNAMISAMPDLIFVIDNHGIYTEFYYSDPLVLPIQKENIIGTSLTDFFGEEKAGDYLQHIHECILNQKLITYEYQITENNRIKYFEARIAPYGENKILSVVRDVTTNREKETEILKLSLAVEQSPVSIVITDTKGNIEYVNPAFELATGFSFDEVLGRNPRILKSGKMDEAIYRDLWQTISSGKEWHGEWINRKKNGELYWEDVFITPVFGENGIITNYLGVKQDISLRKQSEKEILELNETLELKVSERTIQLEEALERLRKIADRLPGMVYQYLLRPDGTSCFPYSSEGIREIYRVSPEEIIEDASPIFAVLHPDDLDGVVESIQTSASKLESWNHEYRIKFEDGTIRWLAGNAMPQGNPDGSVLWHGFITDITERKEVDAALAIEKKRLASILEGTNVGTWEWNIQTGETVFNERWTSILGYTLDEISPVSIETWMKFAHPEDLKESGELLEKHFKGELDYYSFESRMLHKNGDWVWVLDRGKVHTWTDDEKPLLMSGTHQDITDRKQAEEALRESQEQLNLVIKGSNDAPWDWNLVTDNLFYSLKWWQQIGFSPEEIPSDSSLWKNRTHPDDIARINEFFKNVLAGTNDSYEAEFRLLHKDGHYLPVLSRGFITRNAEGKPIRVTGTNLDLTDRKKAEDALKKSMELLDESQKLGHVGGWEFNIDTLLQTWTEEVYRIHELEFTHQPTVERGINFYTPESIPIIQNAVQRAIEYCEPFDLELEILTAKGNRRSVKAVGKADLENRRIFGFFQDITERKKANEALVWNKTLLELMSNSSPLGFLVVDNRTDDILYFNQRFCQLWGIEQLTDQMQKGELKNNDIIPYCLPVLADIPAFAESCKPLQDEENRIVVEDEIAFTENRTVRRFTTQIRGENDEYFGRFYIFEDITGQKMAQDALLQKDILHSTMISNISDVIGIMGIDGKMRYKSPNIEKYFGWKPQDLIGTDGWLTIYPDDLDRIQKEFSDLVKNDKSVKTVTYRYKCKNGSYKPIELTATNLANDPVIQGVLLNYHDITEREEAENSLRRSEAEKAAIIRAVPDLMFRIRRDGTLLDYMSKDQNMLYVPEEQFTGKTISQVLPPDLALQSMAAIEKAFHHEEMVAFEYSLTVNGQLRYFEDRIIVSSADEVLSIIRDITYRKESEAALAMQSAAFESFALAIIITDIKGIIQWANSAFTGLTGYQADEIIGKTPGALVKSGKQDKDFYKRFWNTLLNKEVWTGELINRRKDGSLYYEEQSITPVLDSKGNISSFISIKIDITERKRIEHALIVAKNEAEKANQAKSEFLSRMSHELRTPLNSILGFAQLMEMADLSPVHKRNINFIFTGGKHLLSLINEVLDISSIEAGKISLNIEPVQLFWAINEIMDALQPQLQESQIKIELDELSIKELSVMADNKRLKQLLMNLLDNAIKYNKIGGVITISVEIMPKDKHDRVPLRISITDKGKGIKADDIFKIFNPFERIGAEKTETVGTGLGLALVKKLVVAMHGEIGVHSVLGEGSTFWFELPLSVSNLSYLQLEQKNIELTSDLNAANIELAFQNEEKGKRADELKVANIEFAFQNEEKGKRADELNLANIETTLLLEENATLKAKLSEANIFFEVGNGSEITGTILYIEDNISNIELVQQILQEHRAGIRLIIDLTGSQALQLAIENAPDLILLDLNLPDIHGSEILVLLQAEEKTQKIPVIVISADAMPEQIEKLIHLGAKDYLTKPLDVVEFTKVIDKFIVRN